MKNSDVIKLSDMFLEVASNYELDGNETEEELEGLKFLKEIFSDPANRGDIIDIFRDVFKTDVNEKEGG